MKQKLFIFLVVLTTLAFTNATAQQTAKMSPAGTGFLQYLPDGYSGNTNKYPVVISLHGIKEKGNTLSSTSIVANVGLPKYVKYGQKYPFILISPQLKTTMGRWTGAYVMEVLNYVKTYLRVDPSRIYLTGLSLGGGGVWSVATSYPTVWAAILPICSGYNLTSLASSLGNNDVPVWGFHGDADGVVSEFVTINMINAINNYKPSPLAKVTIFGGLGHVIWDKVYKQTNALDWMLSFRKGSTSSTDNTSTGNSSPVANAGADKTLTLPTNSVTVYGSASDSDGTISSYAWTKTSGGTATLSGTTTKDLKLSNLVAGTYTFRLTAKDNSGATDTDDVTVTVKSSTTSTTNKAPVANAGTDRAFSLPTNSTTLYGSGSDSDGSIVSYSWTKTSGGSATMSGNTTKTLKLTNLVSGTYTFTLTVKDDKGATDTDYAVVVVKGTSSGSTADSGGTTTSGNKAPVASAGTDRTFYLPTNSTTLYGGGTDSDGTIASYTWTKTSGPSATMSGSTTKTLKLTNLVAGSYTFTITVKDNDGAIDTDYAVVVVKSSSTASTSTGSNKAPVANAGTDRLFSLPTNSTNLFGSGADTDGSIVAYKWVKSSGGMVTMSGTTSRTLKLTNLHEGTYKFTLTVKDNDGAVDTDYAVVVVKDATAGIKSAEKSDSELAGLESNTNKLDEINQDQDSAVLTNSAS